MKFPTRSGRIKLVLALSIVAVFGFLAASGWPIDGPRPAVLPLPVQTPVDQPAPDNVGHEALPEVGQPALPEDSAAVVQPAAKDGYRTWRDASRTRTVSAKFISLKGDEVTLLRADGRTYSFPIRLLCAEDQKFVKAQQEPQQEPVPIHPAVYVKPVQELQPVVRPATKDSPAAIAAVPMADALAFLPQIGLMVPPAPAIRFIAAQADSPVVDLEVVPEIKPLPPENSIALPLPPKPEIKAEGDALPDLTEPPVKIEPVPPQDAVALPLPPKAQAIKPQVKPQARVYYQTPCDTRRTYYCPPRRGFFGWLFGR